MRLQATGHKVQAAILYLIFTTALINMFGCEAFVRKFTRKPKEENLPATEMVLIPEEYKDTMAKQELYRQYFLFWKSWQDELINALSERTNYKKQVSSANEALKNLGELKSYLNTDKQKILEGYIEELDGLRDALIKDVYGTNIRASRDAAERIKRGILKDFSYNKVKDSLL